MNISSSRAQGRRYVAHRAGNSVASIRSSEALGSIAEVDVHRNRNGELEARHEKRVWFTSRFWDRWYVLPVGTRPVPLDEIVRSAEPSTVFWFDLKGPDPRLGWELSALLADSVAASVSSKAWWQLRPFLDLPAVTTFRSVGNRLELVILLVRLMVPTRVDGVVIHQRLLSARVLRRLTWCSYVFTWDANSRSRIAELEALGVNGFIVDDLGAVSRRDSTSGDVVEPDGNA